MLESALLSLMLGCLLFIPSLLLYVPFPSKWNLVAHFSVAMAATTYLFPNLDLEILDGCTPQAVYLALSVCFCSLFFYFTGILCCCRASFSPFNIIFPSESLFEDSYKFWISVRRVNTVLLASVVGAVLCFFFMGFVPIFAEDQYAAKYMRGQYQEKYDQVAWLYRSSIIGIHAFAPIAFTVAFIERQIYPLVVWVSSITVILGTMSRGAFGRDILFSLAPFVMNLRSGGKLLLGLLTLSCAAGALANGPIKYLSGTISFEELVDVRVQGKNFSKGAGDLPETVHFLQMFNATQEWTYGRTFFGALVPYRYDWNPAVYSLSVLSTGSSGSDVDGFVSGGIRLPMAVWGYAAYSYLGVVLLSFFVGAIHGTLLSMLRDRMDENDFIKSAFVVLVFFSTSAFVWSPHWLSLYNLPPLILWSIILRTPPIRLFGRIHI